MKVGVIYIDSGWILQTIALKMCEADDRFIPIPIGHNRFPACDFYYYVDVQNCWNPEFRNVLGTAKHVGMFTHLDGDSGDSFRKGWDQLDGVVHMATRYEKMFSRWYQPEKLRTISPGEVSQFDTPPINFGIVQRGGHVGKGSDFLPDVIASLPSSVRGAMTLHFCGKGWVESSGEDYHGVPALNYKEDDWQSMYQRCDYIIIPSLWEGGPMSLLEALATGTGIIAAEVGFVGDLWDKYNYGFSGNHFTMFTPGDVRGCGQRICNVVAPRVQMRSIVENLSYSNYAAHVYTFMEQL